MTVLDLQAHCELGQQQLMAGRYLEAEATLASAEREAWGARDWDTLARLYMPLQEARRQRRQCCGEGVVCLDLIAQGPDDVLEARHVVENYPQGQLLVAGWHSIQPALDVRRLQAKHGLYLETFLAAVYPAGRDRAVVIVPLEELQPFEVEARSLDDLRAKLPSECIVLSAADLPEGSRRGTAQTYGQVMDLWERLHTPFLRAAEATPDPIQRMEAFRKTIDVDYGCELAHQHLSDTARELARRSRAGF